MCVSRVTVSLKLFKSILLTKPYIQRNIKNNVLFTYVYSSILGETKLMKK